MQHKGEDLAGGAVDSQLIAVQSLADIVLRIAEVAGPADANLIGSALQAVLGACLCQGGEAEAEQGQSQSEYCRWGGEDDREDEYWLDPVDLVGLTFHVVSALRLVRLVWAGVSVDGIRWNCGTVL